PLIPRSFCLAAIASLCCQIKTQTSNQKIMKKVLVIFSLSVLAMANKVSAQALVARLTTRGGAFTSYSVQGIKEGLNTITLPEGNGTLTFTKSGNTYRGVTYVNNGTLNLEPTAGGANGAPKPECKTTLPDACFSSPDKNIGMCICKPDKLSAGTTPTYTLAFKHLGIFKNN